MMEITLVLENESKEPLYLQLYKYFKQEIQSGRIETGVMLPSKRKLSLHLGVSQNTVETAYQQLLAEGYVDSRPRKGIFVKEIHSDLILTSNEILTPTKRIPKRDSDICLVDFSHGKIALDHFPFTHWRRLTIQSLFEDESSFFLNGEYQGEYHLREEIARYLYQSRGVRCSTEQVIIGAGTQYLIGFLTMIIGREAIFSMEDPGYHRTREAFKDQGVNLIPISLDDEGMNMKQLYASNAQITYVTPSHQFPMGMVMPITRRLELLKWAGEEENRFIIEDDYDGEFRYKGKPIPSLQGLDPNGKVIYLGTFSKSLIPSIRINYIVLPKILLAKYNEHFTLYKQTVSRLHQHTLWLFMREGHWERHLNKMRTVYRKRQQSLISSIKKNMGDQVTIIGDDSGLHILLRVYNAMSEKELIAKAQKYQVKVYPTSVYFEDSCSNHVPMILLGFGGLTESEIDQGILLLKKAWNLS
ncbi:MocR-like pyridoxine biosynthesis transcription factor PdxR [Neobacillus cucumis]|uniref:GntR family transcriptional regulator n=1 Tax=Neobacillus cucumis TaxID=1740721 RepID=A0A2N5HSW1_9BACI|nr:PLP-dependent aminotransferase family protein [Neobacillus cucumis]PLS08600.1 GntR family transcriptional regulator [Neobacillus cucumis]